MCPLPGAAASGVNSQFNQPTYSSPSTFASPNVPNFPGATSVQPLGQPTYSPAPTGNYAPSTPGIGNNAVLPNNSTYAPGPQPTMGGVADPESMRQPTFSGNTSVQKATTDHLVNSSEQNKQSNRPPSTSLLCMVVCCHGIVKVKHHLRLSNPLPLIAVERWKFHPLCQRPKRIEVLTKQIRCVPRKGSTPKRFGIPILLDPLTQAELPAMTNQSCCLSRIETK